MSDTEPVRGRWKKGESGNPSGRAKRIAELHAMAQENYPLALKRLEELINSRDEDMAFKAVSFTFLYVLGRPLEGSALLHMDAMRAKLTELVVAKSPEAPPALPPPAVPEKVEAPPLTRLEAPPPPEALRVDSGDAKAPSGLRCLYRGKDGQCHELAVTGASWCAPHKEKLLGSLNA